MLRYTQILILEIGHLCNLAKEHCLCPVTERKTMGGESPLLQSERVAIAQAAYRQHGFRGFVAFHFYNEPMLRAEEMFDTMRQTRDAVPAARFLLWTNGTITPDDERMRLFDKVVCSNYRDNAALEGYYRKYAADVQVNPANGNWQFDGRLSDWRANPAGYARCMRPLVEFIIDDWGRARLCCQDWRGEVEIGDYRRDGLDAMLLCRQSLTEDICRPMKECSPERCVRCAAKIGPVPFDAGICEAGAKYYES